jgi:hypothetical protein
MSRSESRRALVEPLEGRWRAAGGPLEGRTLLSTTVNNAAYAGFNLAGTLVHRQDSRWRFRSGGGSIHRPRR